MDVCTICLRVCESTGLHVSVDTCVHLVTALHDIYCMLTYGTKIRDFHRSITLGNIQCQPAFVSERCGLLVKGLDWTHATLVPLGLRRKTQGSHRHGQCWVSALSWQTLCWTHSTNRAPRNGEALLCSNSSLFHRAKEWFGHYRELFGCLWFLEARCKKKCMARSISSVLWCCLSTVGQLIVSFTCASND